MKTGGALGQQSGVKIISISSTQRLMARTLGARRVTFFKRHRYASFDVPLGWCVALATSTSRVHRKVAGNGQAGNDRALFCVESSQESFMNATINACFSWRRRERQNTKCILGLVKAESPAKHRVVCVSNHTLLVANWNLKWFISVISSEADRAGWSQFFMWERHPLSFLKWKWEWCPAADRNS